MKIAFFSTKSYDRAFFKKINTNHHIEFYNVGLSISTVKLTQGFDAICVFVNDQLDKNVLKELSKLGIGLIALRCAGFNNIDLKVAHELKIKVVRVPSYSPMAVAEHAVALIMSLNRKIHKAFNRVREGNFSLENLTGFDVYNKTIGVIGTGKIGSCFSKIMLGFGCKVVAYDIYPSEELVLLGVKYVSLEELYKSSDIISLHCPLFKETYHLIDESAFAQMKKGVMLINTSRGGLINTVHAISALKKEHIGYLGIDVYEQEEKLFFQDLSENIIDDDVIIRLISFPNVIITAHQGFLTHEALEHIAETTILNFNEFEKRNKLTNEVSILID